MSSARARARVKAREVRSESPRRNVLRQYRRRCLRLRTKKDGQLSRRGHKPMVEKEAEEERAIPRKPLKFRGLTSSRDENKRK